MEDLNLSDEVKGIGNGVQPVRQNEVASKTLICFIDEDEEFHFGYCYRNGSNLEVVCWELGTSRLPKDPVKVIAFEEERKDKDATEKYQAEDFQISWFDLSTQNAVKKELILCKVNNNWDKKLDEDICKIGHGIKLCKRDDVKKNTLLCFINSKHELRYGYCWPGITEVPKMLYWPRRTTMHKGHLVVPFKKEMTNKSMTQQFQKNDFKLDWFDNNKRALERQLRKYSHMDEHIAMITDQLSQLNIQQLIDVNTFINSFKEERKEEDKKEEEKKEEERKEERK